jgi:phosphoribosyl-ATP pyrophosphohydrolase
MPPSDARILAELERVLRDRREQAPAGSYSAELLADPEAAQRKLMEEAFELCLELGREPVEPDRAASEAADVVFHLLVGLVGAGVSWEAVLAELAARRRHAATPTDGAEAGERS